jgi:hypothetical protein
MLAMKSYYADLTADGMIYDKSSGRKWPDSTKIETVESYFADRMAVVR